MHDPNRRTFLKTTTAAAAATALPASARVLGANDRVRIALIGPGGMGMNHLRSFASYDDVEIATVCDVDTERLAQAAAAAKEISGREPKTVKDMREILDDANIDAVVIATPDHWHAPATVLACRAGKHVYVEKPPSHNFREGRLMIEAAREHKVVVQTGTQSRSTATIRAGIEKLRSGAIGEILVAKAWNSQRRGSIGKTQPSDPPVHLDFDLWLGPALVVPYRSNMLHSIWRWWHDFGCGDIGNDGVHDLDIARWGLGMDAHPNRVAALGGKYFFDDDQQWPDTQYISFEYDPPAGSGRPRQLVFEQRIWSPYHQQDAENGNAFYGTEGYMILSKSWGWKLYGPRDKLLEEAKGGVDLRAHHRNWLDAIRGEAELTAPIEDGHRSAALCHLGNVATRVRRVLDFDAANEQVRGDEEATALLRRSYRDHWASLA